MRITVEVLFSFKHEMDSSAVVLDLADGSDVLSALRALVEHYPRITSRLFSPTGAVHRYVNALVNGENVTFRQGFATRLRDGDRLTLLPPVGGG